MRFIYSLLSIFTFFIASPAFAVDMIGHVSYLHGDVKITRDNGATSETLTSESKIRLNDTILTVNDSSQVEITFIDNTTIELSGADGSLVVDEYVYDVASPEKNKANYNILKGSFKYVSGLLPKQNNNAQINLDFGSIGIRGTTIFRAMKDHECWIYVEEGQIDVFNDGGKVSLGENDGTRMSARDVAPHDPKPWGQKNIDWIKSTVARSE